MASNVSDLGFVLPNGSRIVHGAGSNVKEPFEKIPVVMHELNQGSSDSDSIAYRGQFGFIQFNDDLRLPRHVHMVTDSSGTKRFVAERILVLNGVAMVELAGAYFVIPSGGLVEIAGGVPHTWNACPAGVRVGDDVSTGDFTMVYEYEEPTSFFATEHTNVLKDVDQYVAYKGDLEAIRFPQMSNEEVVARADGVWGKDLVKVTVAAQTK